MSNTEDYTFRVWVGCLACYNAGMLVGAWFDADDCPTNETDFDERVTEHARAKAGDPNPHEEIWVFDHENSPVSGEYSPNQAAQWAEWLEGLEDDQRPAFDAWLKHTGNDFDDDAVGNFQDAFLGEYEGGHYGTNFVGTGYAESIIEDEVAQAKQIVEQCARYAIEPRSASWLIEKIERWGSMEDASQRAWEMEANGEMVALEGPDHQAYIFTA